MNSWHISIRREGRWQRLHPRFTSWAEAHSFGLIVAEGKPFFVRDTLQPASHAYESNVLRSIVERKAA